MIWRITYSAARFRWWPKLDRFGGELERVRWLWWLAYKQGGAYWWEQGPSVVHNPPPFEDELANPRLVDRPGYEPGSPEEAAYLASERERMDYGDGRLCYGANASQWLENGLSAAFRRDVAHGLSVRADLEATWADDQVRQTNLFPADGFNHEDLLGDEF